MTTLTAFLRFVRSNAVGLVALLVALSGTAYAATALPHNSVGPAQLRTDAVRSRDVAAHAIGRGDVSPQVLGFVDGGISTDDPHDPPTAGGSEEIGAREVVLPRAGRVLVTFTNTSLALSCNPSGVPRIGLYWDGQPIAGSATVIASTNTRPALLVAKVRSGRGSHRASARWFCDGGARSSSSRQNDSFWTFQMS
jgi:hypothetical protein